MVVAMAGLSALHQPPKCLAKRLADGSPHIVTEQCLIGSGVILRLLRLDSL